MTSARGHDDSPHANGGVIASGSRQLGTNLNLSNQSRASISGHEPTKAAANRNKRVVFTDNGKVRNSGMNKPNKKSLYTNMYGNAQKISEQANYEEQ